MCVNLVAAGQVGATAPTAALLAAAITLVPVQLLEFRYFIIPIALAIVFTATVRAVVFYLYDWHQLAVFGWLAPCC